MSRALVLVTLALFAVPASAQRPPAPGGNRPELEAEFRRELTRAVKDRVGLTDQQMAALAPITGRLADERRRLQLEERNTRVALQRSLRAPAAADSAEVARLLQRLVDVQKRRVQLVEAEQRELATIMTPIQRARFTALQEQVRRRVEQRRGGPPNGGASRGRPRPAP